MCVLEGDNYEVNSSKVMGPEYLLFNISGVLQCVCMYAHTWWKPDGVRGPSRWPFKQTTGIHHACTLYLAQDGACTQTRTLLLSMAYPPSWRFSHGLNSKLVSRLCSVPWLGGYTPLMEGWGGDNLRTGSFKVQDICMCVKVQVLIIIVFVGLESWAY